MAAFNLIWEALHLPLYTIWREKPLGANIVAALHCTLGDVVLAGATLVAGLALTGRPDWPRRRFVRVTIFTSALAIAATIYLERLNTRVWRSWSYSDLMPVVLGIDVGLSPLLQWILLPPIALYAARWMADRHAERTSAP